MNIAANLKQLGAKLWKEHPTLRAEVQRIETICKERAFKDSFLGGNTFSIANAFFAPVVMRWVTYGLPVSAQTQQYTQTILQVPAIQWWITDAKQEQHLVKIQEPDPE